MRANTTTVNSVLNTVYDNTVYDALRSGPLLSNVALTDATLDYFEKTGNSTMWWRTTNTTSDGKEEAMDIKAGTAQVKGGYLALVFNGQTVVWESNKRFKTQDKAWDRADQKIKNTISTLFNK